jgi:hypothetical protein
MPRCFMSARSLRGTHAGGVIEAAGAKAARLKAEADRAAEIARRLQKLADDDTEGNVDETAEWLELVKFLKDCGEAPGRIGMEANDRSVDIGSALARQVFSKRGNNSEVHVSEAELAALIALGVQRAEGGRR